MVTGGVVTVVAGAVERKATGTITRTITRRPIKRIFIL
jgi:hypothetical protein